nr:HigA family addiction module antitoxin [Corynebacterium lactis]
MSSTHPVHPGSILNDNFLEPRALSIYRLAVAIGVPSSTLERFRSGRTSVTNDLAQRLSTYFDTEPEYWLNSQREFNMKAAA